MEAAHGADEFSVFVIGNSTRRQKPALKFGFSDSEEILKQIKIGPGHFGQADFGIAANEYIEFFGAAMGGAPYGPAAAEFKFVHGVVASFQNCCAPFTRYRIMHAPPLLPHLTQLGLPGLIRSERAGGIAAARSSAKPWHYPPRRELFTRIDQRRCGLTSCYLCLQRPKA